MAAASSAVPEACLSRDAAGDGETRDAHEQEGRDAAAHDGPEGVSSGGLGVLRPLLQERVLPVLHLADRSSDVVHDLLSALRLNHRQGGIEPLLLPQVDGLPELLQLGRDQRLQGIEAALLLGVVDRELPDVLEGRVDALSGGGVRLQVAVDPRKEVAPLACLGVLQRGEHAVDLGENRVRVRHLVTRLDEPVRASVRHPADHDQDRQRHGEARPHLPCDRPAHVAALLGCLCKRPFSRCRP